jgi:hypothetical protein
MARPRPQPIFWGRLRRILLADVAASVRGAVALRGEVRRRSALAVLDALDAGVVRAWGTLGG